MLRFPASAMHLVRCLETADPSSVEGRKSLCASLRFVRPRYRLRTCSRAAVLLGGARWRSLRRACSATVSRSYPIPSRASRCKVPGGCPISRSSQTKTARHAAGPRTASLSPHVLVSYSVRVPRSCFSSVFSSRIRFSECRYSIPHSRPCQVRFDSRFEVVCPVLLPWPCPWR